jgi:hypothetical protein
LATTTKITPTTSTIASVESIGYPTVAGVSTNTIVAPATIAALMATTRT